MAARDLILFGIAVILASGFLLVHDVLVFGHHEQARVLYLGVLLGLALAFVGVISSQHTEYAE